MSQRILNVKVRPFLVAVLLGKNASQDDVLLSLKFLSSLWGGRYCQLLAAEPDGNDRLTCSRLSESRPDLVYGVGIDHTAWNERVQEACQPRGYGCLEAKYVENLHESIEEHVTAAHVIRYLRRTPFAAGQPERMLRIFGCDPKSPMQPFVAALFGMHYENLGSAIPNQSAWFSETSNSSELIALQVDVTSKYHRTWLDLTSHELTFSFTPLCSPPPPTIILVDSLASDLALFWNLRQAAAGLVPPWVIPLPSNTLLDSAVPQRLKEWLQVWERCCRCESCRVTSTSVPRPMLTDFARQLQEEVKGTMITRVDVWEPTNRLPLVVPFESDQQLTVQLSRQTLTFHPPRPKLLEEVSKGSWIVELIQDVRRGRAVKELCLPPRRSAFAVLNAPGPTSFPMTWFPRLGDGVDGINIHCSGRTEVVRVFLPTGDEVLEEVLQEAGINPVLDEKRACYRPVMRMFGGLDRSAQALSGQRGTVLKALLAGPLQLGEVQGKAKLGNGKLAELAEPEVPKAMLNRLDLVAKRTFRGRRRRLWNKLSPSTTAVESRLEFWADNGILARQWRVGPCSACMGSFWEHDLDISKPVACPGCGNRLRLPPQVPMGYSLHRLVGHAIREGIVPVVLAGRFLSNLTHEGFLWLPGVKYRWNDKDGDLDILACCDGHLVVGECKTLGDTPQDTGFWEVILKQFAETIKMGQACRASLAVLAVMAENYPPEFQHKVDQLTGPTMRSLLLNKQDLEQGHRPMKEVSENITRHLSLSDLIVDPMPETPRARPVESGEIQTPIVSITY
jgi:hypothetical protein